MTRAGLRRFAAGFALVALAYPLAYAGVEIFEPAFRDRPKATQFPGREAASRLTAEWRQRYGTPLAYVAGTEFASNNIAVYSPDRPHVVVHADPSISPWIDRADLARRGAILVWENAGPPPAGFLDRFPAAEIRPPLVLPRLTRFAVAPDIVGYAFVAPKP